MKIYIQSEKIYIANQAIDFRKSIDGLCSMVIELLEEDPGEGLYIFYNKNRNRIKIISRHVNGFILIYKKLDKGKFFVEETKNKIKISRQQLDWLLLGTDWKLLSKENVKYSNYF